MAESVRRSGGMSEASYRDPLQHAPDLDRLPLGPTRDGDAALVERLGDLAERGGTLEARSDIPAASRSDARNGTGGRRQRATNRN
jgi:hypothetical protein